MKAKTFEATKVPNLTGKRARDTLSRAEVVALVAARVRDDYDDDRTVRNRVSTNVYDDVKAGRLRKKPSGVFSMGDVGAWARTQWPGKFDDLPRPPKVKGKSEAMLLEIRASGVACTDPTTLSAAITEIHDLLRTIGEQAGELAAAKERIRKLEKLETDAVKWREWIIKKRGKRKSK